MGSFRGGVREVARGSQIGEQPGVDRRPVERLAGEVDGERSVTPPVLRRLETTVRESRIACHESPGHSVVDPVAFGVLAGSRHALIPPPEQDVPLEGSEC